MLYMELTPCSFTHRSYHCYSLRLFLWTEMLYMELFIYLSQLPLLLVLAYSCGLRHSIWSESIHENLIFENSVWVAQAMDS